jgi:osmotically-inducible protein OsmY
MKFVVVALLLVSAGLGLTGCTPIGIVVGGAAAAGVVAAEERSVSDAVKDSGIKISITEGLLSESEALFVDVTTNTVEGRVMVTGQVKTTAQRERVSEIIWSIDGVKEVLNELQIGDQGSFTSSTEDTWISTKLKARLLQDVTIKHVNYSVDTVNRVVYLMGIAQDVSELERVYLHARDISGVRKIINHVVMKDSRPQG